MRLPLNLRPLLIYALAAAAVSALAAPKGEKLSRTFVGAVQVTAVSDGDTLSVLGPDGAFRVRIRGGDAPEVPSPREKTPGQPHGLEAQRWLRGLLDGRTVQLSCPKLDRYARRVCDVDLAGASVMAEALRQGHAWFDHAHAGELNAVQRLQFQSLELAARAHRVGLWAVEYPENPSAYRARLRAAKGSPR